MKPTEVVSQTDQKLLLDLARNAIKTTLEKGRRLPVVESLSPILREKRGAFVTLWLEGELRGCIGFPTPQKPLVEAVQEAAVGAALQDNRFPMLRLEELPKVWLEISVLTEPKPLDPAKVKVGVHGLIARQGPKSGLLLPQVAMDFGWSRETFLDQTCAKAGLPKGSWRQKTEVLGFEAQVFGEIDFKNSAAKS
ncbi:MAG TPA: AmmeMemoRadiSam system protein A [bacterium]|nr:AmmeMemoRadiSam system protein A [bacterium]